MNLIVRLCFVVTILLSLGLSAMAGALGCMNNADCDDGLFCTPAEICEGGVCITAGLFPCAAGIEGCLVFGSCDEETDSCPGVPNDSFCDGGLICNESGECVEPPPPMGACCIDGGEVCEFMEAQGCDGDSVFVGVDESCEPNPCVEPPPGPTVVVPTMNQWGIIFASIILGAIGIVALIREKNMGKYFDK